MKWLGREADGSPSSYKRLQPPSYNESNARENASARIAFSSLVTVCWIDETASNLVPLIAIFNLGNKKKSQSALNQGSRVDGITRGSLVSPKARRQRSKNAPAHCRAEDTRTHFPETRAQRNELERSIS
jgi:hypothetical protein